MRAIVRTIYGISFQTALNLGLKYEVRRFTTINEVMTDPDVVPFQPVPPTLGMERAAPYDMEKDSANIREQLIVIGNRGHRHSQIGKWGIDKMDVVPHIATDAGLFGMIPFVIRPVTDDLPPSIAKNYRLRKTMWIHDALYVAYYGRKLQVESVVPEETVTEITNGLEVKRPFVPNINNLKPKPRTINGEGNGSYVEAIANVEVKFGAQEIKWLEEVGNILFGEPDLAIVSEIAFCHCVDKPVTERFPNSGNQNPSPVPPGEKSEAVAVQVSTFVSTYLTPDLNGGFGGIYDLGGYDPLYGITDKTKQTGP